MPQRISLVILSPPPQENTGMESKLVQRRFVASSCNEMSIISFC